MLMELSPPSNSHIRLARGLAGIQPAYGGRDLDGASCVGLMWLYYQRIGVEFDLLDYDKDWYETDPESLIRHIREVLGWPRLCANEQILPGDLLVFGVLTDFGDHPGVYLGGTRFLHSAPSGSVVASFRDVWWRLLVAAFRPCPVTTKHLASSSQSLSAP